jgi:hypothetical protein
MQLFAGRKLPDYTNVTKPDLSKPLWERRGFKSKDDMLDAWRAERSKIGISSSGPDYGGIGNPDFSITSNIKSYLNRLLGKRGKAPAPSQPGVSQTSRRDELKHIYERKLYGDRSRTYKHTPSYSADVGDYVNRRVASDVNLKYLDTLARRHSFLDNSGDTSDLRSMLKEDDFSGLTPVRVAEPGSANRGYNASMPRLSMKLDNEVRRGKLDRATMDLLHEGFPISNIRPKTTSPLVVSFKSDKPFGTTNHVANAEITQSRMREVDKAVEKLKHQGIDLTAENIADEVYKTLDPTELRVHAGAPYTPDEKQGMLSGYFGNRINNNYESVFGIGDPNYPKVLERHVGDSPVIRERASKVGLSHIFDRQAISAADMIPDNDMVLFKGTAMPMASKAWRTDERPGAVSRISSAYEDALQSHLNAKFDKPNIHDNDQTVLGTILDIPGVRKYPEGEKTWLTPNPITSSGYGGSDGLFFPVTDDEVRKLFGSAVELDALLNSMPADKQKYIANLISHYGDYSRTEKFRDTVNRNRAQMNAMAPRVAKTTPKAIIEALMDYEGKSANLPENVKIYNPVRYTPHWNVLKKAYDL